ncbi:MAG TPA: cytochrome c [Gammaproteobacteria bacterium]|jgi:mono/diheme cytochrome c family protein|nr:cytochrome c [Gammaproteobacteria bacterium]
MKLKAFSSKIFCLAITILAVNGVSGAQSDDSIWSGVFTAQQAARGAADYSTNCASCHSVDLRGNSNTPSLLGMSFMFIWEDRSLGELYTKMRDEMPSDRPGSLSTQSYEDLLAYLLQSNQFPAGEKELKASAGMLDKISITSKP